MRLCRQHPARARADEPDHQRARRDAEGRHDHRHRAQRPGCRPTIRSTSRPATMSCSRSGTAAAAFPPNMLEQVTEPFFTTKDVGEGTGLGLSMVYGFARQSGGAIDIDSKVGEGTMVEIWLPRAPEAKRARRASRPNQRDRRPPTSRPLRILLVDDHEAVRETTAGMLCDMGHKVETGRRRPVDAEMLEAAPRRLRPHRHRLCDAADVGRRHAQARRARSGPICPASSSAAMPTAESILAQARRGDRRSPSPSRSSRCRRPSAPCFRPLPRRFRPASRRSQGG